MKIELLKAARIQHKAGDIVEVSPVAADFLIAVGSAKKYEPKKKKKDEEKEG